MNTKPVIFLAFANDKVDNTRYLRNLADETYNIRTALQEAEEQGLCELVVRTALRSDELFDIFQDNRYRGRIAVFHYGGHADGYQLLLEEAGGNVRALQGGGLVKFFAAQEGLELVFLNGCSTEQQSQELSEAGVPAVIGTSNSIQDSTATDLAKRFYAAIGQGQTLGRAWQDAVSATESVYGGEGSEKLFRLKRNEAVPAGLPWKLLLRADKNAGDWNMGDAGENPLFGLPEPADNYDLPEKPYRYLQPYQRSEQGVFFGRSAYIRELYNRMADEQAAPVVLFYGQSGAGKSSLLEAGLLPRLERKHQCEYFRRDPEKGMAEQLKNILHIADFQTNSGEENDKLKAETEALIAEVERLRDKLDEHARPGTEQTLAALRQKLNLLQIDQSENSQRALWKARETDRPMSILADQIEEIFTRPLANRAKELADLLDVIKEIFADKTKRPKGKLLLSYRKEFHAEIKDAFRQKEIAFHEVFLKRPSRKDLAEIIKGLNSKELLRTTYRLQIEETEEYNLPVLMADDLLEDPDSPVVPLLQILLCDMWENALPDESGKRFFNGELYRKMRSKGMDDFLRKQNEIAQKLLPEAWESGLAADLLNFHTTAKETAGSRKTDEIISRYADRKELINNLLGIMLRPDIALLTAAGASGFTSLPHDTVASSVRKMFNESVLPGQVALRIIEAVNRDIDDENVLLSKYDLQKIESGRAGMRVLSPEEEQLILRSKAYWENREKELEEKNRLLAAHVTVMSAGKAAEAGMDTLALQICRRAVRRAADEPEVQRMASKLYSRFTDRGFARQIYRCGITTNEVQWAVSPETGRGMILTVSEYAMLSDENENRLAFFPHENVVNSGVFSPDGKSVLTASADGTAVLWNLAGEPLLTLTREYGVNHAVFSPAGDQILIGDSDYFAVLYDLNGKELAICEHDESVTKVGFSPDGSGFFTLSEDGSAGIWEANGQNIAFCEPEEGELTDACFSPDGKYLGTATSEGVAVIWTSKGKEKIRFEHEDYINSLRFSPDGKFIVTASTDKSAVIWDLKGEMITTVRHNDSIKYAEFSPDGQLILTASDDRTAGVWYIDGTHERSFRHESYVFCAHFVNNEQIITGANDGTAAFWDIYSDLLVKVSHTNIVLTARFSPDFSKIVTASEDCTAAVHTSEGDFLFDIEHASSVYSAMFSPDGRHILTACEDGQTALFDLSGKKIKYFQAESGLVFADFSVEGERIAAAAYDGNIFIFNKELKKIGEFNSNCTPGGLTLNRAGNEILVFGSDEKATLYNEKGEILAEYPHKKWVHCAVFSPDESQILTCSEDKSAILWQKTGEKIKTFKLEDIINRGAFSADGQYIALAADCRFAAVLRIADGREVRRFFHNDLVRDVAFGPNNRLLTASNDVTAVLSAPAEDLQQKQCANYALSEMRHYGVPIDFEELVNEERPDFLIYNAVYAEENDRPDIARLCKEKALKLRPDLAYFYEESEQII